MQTLPSRAETLAFLDGAIGYPVDSDGLAASNWDDYDEPDSVPKRLISCLDPWSGELYVRDAEGVVEVCCRYDADSEDWNLTGRYKALTVDRDADGVTIEASYRHFRQKLTSHTNALDAVFGGLVAPVLAR